MENASKSLLIAAGTLIAVLILSLFVYLYIQMNSFSHTYNERIASQKLHAFNVQFEVYNGRDDLTPQDLVSVANLAKEYNDKNNLSNGDNRFIKVIVRINGTTVDLINQDNKDKFIFMQQYSNDRFKCNRLQYNSETEKVNEIQFIKQ